MNAKGLLVVLTSVVLSTYAFGATITVRQDGSGDHVTIAAALTAAGTGDVIDVGPGTYPEALYVTKSVTLKGSAIPGATILDGQNSFRQIHVDGHFNVTIRGFEFTNGYGDNGAALLIWNTPSVLVEECIFYNNHAFESNALHIRHPGTQVTVRNCEFRSNTCALKSAAIGIGAGGYLRLEDSVFVDNVAPFLSGAINCTEAMMDVQGCLFLRNSSPNTGAMVYSDSSGLVNNNTFVENSGQLNGSVFLTTGVIFSQNIVAYDRLGAGLTTFGATHTDNLYFGNATVSIVGDGFSPGEIETDPLFCDRQSEDFTLCLLSQALASVNGFGLIGAFAQGCTDCGVVAIEKQNWGSLKAMFR